MRRTLLLSCCAVIILLTFGLAIRASLPTVATGAWKAASPMASARTGAAAAVLYDGRILITGGTAPDGTALASAEIFNPDGTFSSAAPMKIARSGHTATWLLNGYVLVTGGATTGGGILNSAEIYDPVADTWTLLPSTMADARTGHTATQLPDGNVLLAGGANSAGALASVEVFSLTQESFSFAGTMSWPRTAHVAAALNDGRVLIAGGTDANGATLASTDIYDPNTGTVVAGPALTTPRAAATATTLLDGTVLIAAGRQTSSQGAEALPPVTTDLSSADIYDPAKGTITRSAQSLIYPRSGQQAFLLPNNNSVLLAGGTLAGNDLPYAELYTPWTGKSSATGTMSVPRSGAVGAPLTFADGLVLVAGGDIRRAPSCMALRR
jgi:hypothetical protein